MDAAEEPTPVSAPQPPAVEPAPAPEETAVAVAAEEAGEAPPAPAEAPLSHNAPRAAPPAMEAGALVPAEAGNTSGHSPAKSPGRGNSPGSARKSVTRTDLMAVHAAECAANAERNRSRDSRQRHSLQHIAALQKITSLDPSAVGRTIALIEEDDRNLFTALPDYVKPRSTPRRAEFDREGALARRNFCRNTEYKPTPRQAHADPRAIVDINRPITPRFTPGQSAAHAAAPKGATSRYAGLRSGAAGGLSSDPLYNPGPDSRRRQVEAAREQRSNANVAPLTAEQLQRKRGKPFAPATGRKVERDFVPGAASRLPDNHGDEGRERRSMAEQRASVKAFK